MAKRFLSIKNYEQYQHYKERNPPWIKLHISLLDDPDFLELPDASKWHYVGLLLLASRHGNDIKPDEKYIANRLGLTEKLDLSKRYLRDHVIASNASKMLLTNSKFGGSEERRDRGETETETEVEAVQVLRKPSPPRSSSDDEWLAWLQTNPAYTGLNIERERHKCLNWCQENHCIFSRRRFINWLNKADRPINTNGKQELPMHVKQFLERGER